MRSKIVLAAAVVVGFLFLLSSAVFCQEKISGLEWTQVVEQIGDKGRINWTEGYIEAVGIGAPPDRSFGKPNARPLALRAARIDAYRNLLEVTKGVRIDSLTTVKDFTVESDVINAQVDGIVKGARPIGEPSYLSDGTVEITLRMPLAGGFAQIIIPKLLEKKPEAIPPAAPAPAPPAPAAAPPAPAPAPEAALPAPAPPEPAPSPKVAPPAPAPPASVPPAAVVYTGLVLDARGIQARPAMSPKILDETGKEVYGTMSVDREYAIQQGMSGYARDLTAAQSNPRVTNNPVSIKGIKTEGAGRADIIISNADAQMIRANAENLSFLKKCRVMIVLD